MLKKEVAALRDRHNESHLAEVSSSNTSHTPHQAKLNKPVSQLNPILERKSPPESSKMTLDNSRSRDKTPPLDAILGKGVSHPRAIETTSHRPSVPRILTNPTFESLHANQKHALSLERSLPIRDAPTRVGVTPNATSGNLASHSNLSKYERRYGYEKGANRIALEQADRDAAVRRRNEANRRANHLERQLRDAYAEKKTGPFGKRSATLQPHLYEFSGASGRPLVNQPSLSAVREDARSHLKHSPVLRGL